MNSIPSAVNFPQEILNELTRTEILLSELLFSLMKGTSRRVPSKAFYSCAGQRWLAKRLNVSREWISISVNKLERLGIIDITHRRKKYGIWQTNLYRVGAAMKKGWKTLKRLFFLRKGRVKYTPHIVHKDIKSRTEIRTLRGLSDSSPFKTFEETIAHCLQRLEKA